MKLIPKKYSKHPLISFLAGFMLTAVILGIVSFVYLILTFNLAGGETLQEEENQRLALLIITILIAMLTFVIVRRVIKIGKKYLAIGISILPSLALVLASYYYITNINSHAPFNKTAWEQSKIKPFAMSATLTKEKALIGLTWQQIKDMLGQGDEEHGDETTERGSITYVVEKDWTLIIYFEKDKVVEAKLRRPMMMTERINNNQNYKIWEGNPSLA